MTIRLGAVLAISAALFVATSGAANAATSDGDYMSKLGSALEYCYSEAMSGGPAQNELFVANMTEDGFVKIDAVASNDADDLAATLAALGGRKISAYHRTVSAELHPTKLANLAASDHLAFARPSLVATEVGLVDSQGDRSMGTDMIRANFGGLDGKGLTIGVLSDSFACDPGLLGGPRYTTPEEDKANDDIPTDFDFVEDILADDIAPGCIDEGRAMAQLIHDVVPGADIKFHTAFGGQADFAGGIVELALAGADVIVDDVIYFAEPMLQDGIIAQAADEVARLGVPYYSSNGNRARDAFQSEYRAVDTGDGIFHDFDPGPGVDTLNEVQLNGALQTNLTFNWDNPNFSVSGAPGAETDVDVIMFDSAGNRVPDCFEFAAEFGFFPLLCQFQFTDGGVPIDGGNGGDAIELVSLVDFSFGAETVQIGFETQSGPAPSFIKFVVFGGGFAAAEYAIDAPSGFGHNNAAGAEGVGAAAFYFTEEFIGDPQTRQLRSEAGESECIPACLNNFSSAGGTPIYFDTEGNRLPEPEVRLKPGITGPDGGNTSFFFSDTSRDDDDGDGEFLGALDPDEFPNFFGTSASAPHVAAVAAILLDSEKSRIKAGNGRFRMCHLDDDDDSDSDSDSDSDDGESAREDGDTRLIKPDRVAEKVAEGWLLGPCHRTEPQEIYDVMRRTAQDMSVRGDNGTGGTIDTFENVPGLGSFDFDSGFGFIDAQAALAEFRDEDDDSDSDSDD